MKPKSNVIGSRYSSKLCDTGFTGSGTVAQDWLILERINTNPYKTRYPN